MSVVVTGAAGFIGGHLVDLLLRRGDRVVGVDRRHRLGAPGLSILTADLLGGDPGVAAALAEADAVVHLAGRPGVRDGGPSAVWARQHDNVAATARLLAAVPLRTPVVVASSSSVYGGTPGPVASSEDHPLRPRGGYARSKVRVEELCAWRAARGGAVTVVRPFTVAGENQRPDMALARWIEAVRTGRPLQILGDPRRTRDITDVRDVAAVLAALAERGGSTVVNIGTGVGHSLADLADAVAAALDVDPELRLRPAHPDEVHHTRADTRRLRRLVGFVPQTDLAALVARQVASGSPDLVETGVPA